MKIIFVLLTTVFWITFALIPEIIMYNIYGLVNPQTELTKIILVGLFWFGGGSLCLLFAFLGVVFWATTIQTVLK